jgi:hypothetical protein
MQVLRDILCLVGVASLVYGCWQIYEPLGWIVLGQAAGGSG